MERGEFYSYKLLSIGLLSFSLNSNELLLLLDMLNTNKAHNIVNRALQICCSLTAGAFFFWHIKCHQVKHYFTYFKHPMKYNDNLLENYRKTLLHNTKTKGLY